MQGDDTMLLTFTLYTAGDYDRRTRHVPIDPLVVASVEEAERRPAFVGYWQVAVVVMVNGERFVVEDGARRAARMVREAKERAAAAGGPRR
jgi:hypothetical protein